MLLLLLVVAIEELGVLATSVVWREVTFDVVATLEVSTDEISAVDFVASVWTLDHAAQVSLFCSFW